MKKKRDALIICNGEVPSRSMMRSLLASKPMVLCADGGANKARSLGIVPEYIIGDLDSVTKSTLRYFKTVPLIQDTDQNSTDLEKTLEFFLSNGGGSATVIGATGDRPDHTMANFSILLKYHHRLRILFFDERCTVQVVSSSIRTNATVGQQISLVPMGVCSGITTTGLRYPLKNESLELGVREGSSNEAISKSISISVRHGALLLFMNHSSIRH